MSRQRFEGPDLEALLASVRRELGPDVRIVEANKVRSGGIGGFFSRERFEVWAEVLVNAHSSPSPAPAPAEPLVDVQPVAAPPVAAPPVAASPVAASPVAVPPTADVATASPTTTPRDLLELADLVSAVEARRQPPVAEPSFASVYARARVDALTAFETNRAPDSDTDRDADRALEPVVRSMAAPVAARAVAPPVAPTPPAATSPMDPPTMTIPPVPTMPPWPGVAVPTPSAAEAPLLRLGLPVELIPPVVAGRDLRSDLIERLESLPPAPQLPRAPGSVVCFVGTQGRAIEAARRAAIEADGQADDVVLVLRAHEGQPPWLVITDVETAATRRRGWWRRAQTTFVAIEPPTGPSESWVTSMLAALEPTLVIGAASAAAKPDDLAAWAGGLAIDALELVELDTTISPASALASGVPVLRLDGALATPAAWADTLIARITP